MSNDLVVALLVVNIVMSFVITSLTAVLVGMVLGHILFVKRLVSELINAGEEILKEVGGE